MKTLKIILGVLLVAYLLYVLLVGGILAVAIEAVCIAFWILVIKVICGVAKKILGLIF